MIKRGFFKLRSPRLYYPTVDPEEDVSFIEIPVPERITLLLPQDKIPPGELYAYIGKQIKTGENIRLSNLSFISPATGKISSIKEYIGYLGKKYYAVSVETSEDEWVKPQDGFPFSVPGCKDLSIFLKFHPPINHLVIMGMDSDLCICTNQIILKEKKEFIKKGIDYIHREAKIGIISIAVPPNLKSFVEDLDLDVYVLKPVYPNAIPKMIAKEILKKAIPQGKEPEDLGIGFLSAEAVANLGSFSEGDIVLEKLVNVISQEGNFYVKARIGTPIRAIFEKLGISVSHRDRIIFGGPMRGKTVYSLDTPVDYDTDGIIIQKAEEIIPSSDTHCINCGECVKVCPVNVPVNMLVRFLENSLFEEAIQYDLLSCIECGLCSYVCIARIPVFHYIMLGKNELKKMEEKNV